MKPSGRPAEESQVCSDSSPLTRPLPRPREGMRPDTGKCTKQDRRLALKKNTVVVLVLLAVVVIVAILIMLVIVLGVVVIKKPIYSLSLKCHKIVIEIANYEQIKHSNVTV